MKRILTLAIVALASGVGQADGSIVARLAGTVSSVIDGSTSNGDRFSVSFTFDEQTAKSKTDTLPLPGIPVDTITAVGVNFGGRAYRLRPDSHTQNPLTFYDNAPTARNTGDYRWAHGESQSDGSYVRLSFKDSSQTLGNRGIPQALSLETIDNVALEFHARDGVEHFVGQLTSVARRIPRAPFGALAEAAPLASVPEPISITIWGLLAATVGASICWKR